MDFDVLDVRACPELLVESYSSSKHEWPMMHPPNQVSSLSPPQFCVSPLPYILCHLPSSYSTTSRRLNVQCDLKNSGIVVRSLAIRFPHTLHQPLFSPKTSTFLPSHSSLVTPVTSPQRPRPRPRPLHDPNSAITQQLISTPLSILRATFFATILHPLEINLNTLAACSCMSIEQLSESLLS